jgi:hypothetical protein
MYEISRTPSLYTTASPFFTNSSEISASLPLTPTYDYVYENDKDTSDHNHDYENSD